jgi:hypothetical protein
MALTHMRSPLSGDELPLCRYCNALRGGHYHRHPSPFADTMANRGMGGMTAPIALPVVGVQPRADSRHVFIYEPTTSPSVRMVTAP